MGVHTPGPPVEHPALLDAKWLCRCASSFVLFDDAGAFRREIVS